jgi:hypothetical protein
MGKLCLVALSKKKYQLKKSVDVVVTRVNQNQLQIAPIGGLLNVKLKGAWREILAKALRM